jgi:hypothetical protein
MPGIIAESQTYDKILPDMGYELHMTRAPSWMRSKETPITHAEWQAFVDGNPELIWEGWTDWETLGRIPTAVWRSGFLEMRFHWYEGEVTARPTSREGIQKMVALAEALGAQVFGDESERYGSDGEAVFEEWPEMSDEPTTS